MTLFYKAQIGNFQGKEVNIIDEIKEYILENYKDKLKDRSSLHEYIVNTPEKLQSLVNKIRHSEQITKSICSQFNVCSLSSLDNTDELYISHYNIWWWRSRTI